MKTANKYGIPLKTIKKWITAFNKNNHCFDENEKEVHFKLINSLKNNTFYDDICG